MLVNDWFEMDYHGMDIEAGEDRVPLTNDLTSEIFKLMIYKLDALKA